MISLRFEPALRLLAHWAPTRSATVRHGELPGPTERSWSEPPDPADFASLVPQRFPLAVEVLNHEVDIDGDDDPARSREEVAAELEALLLAAYPGELPELARELLGQIAFEFADCGDLVRLTVAAEAGGPALDEEHFIARDFDGRTLALALTAPVGADVSPVELLADVAEVLGEYVWLSNNDRLDVTVKAEDHGLGALTDEAFRARWPSSRTSGELLVELWDEEPEAALLDADALAAFRATFTENNLDNARSGAWAAELIEDVDMDDPRSRFPGDRLVELFTAELFDRAAALAGDSPFVYGLGLPIVEEDAIKYGIVAAVVFAGPDRVVTLAVDAGV